MRQPPRPRSPRCVGRTGPLVGWVPKLLTAALVVACAGCAPASAPSRSPEVPGPTATDSVPERWQPSESATSGGGQEDAVLPTPLAAYALTAREMATLDFARCALWRECLKGFGFDYPVPSYKDLVSGHLAPEEETVSR